MARVSAFDMATSVLSQELLLALSEQLKLPLQQIARQAELAQLAPVELCMPNIAVTANDALGLIDNYMLAVQLSQQAAGELTMEPVSVPAVLYDVGARLRPMAKRYGVSLSLEVTGKLGPVIAHRRALEGALMSLGYALIEALPADNRQLYLQLSAHNCRQGIVAGIYSDLPNISTQTLRQGRQLYGRARQPLGSLSHTSGAGVFVADAILQAMQADLTVSRHGKLRGLATVLQPSPQLQLI